MLPYLVIFTKKYFLDTRYYVNLIYLTYMQVIIPPEASQGAVVSENNRGVVVL